MSTFSDLNALDANTSMQDIGAQVNSNEEIKIVKENPLSVIQRKIA